MDLLIITVFVFSAVIIFLIIFIILHAKPKSRLHGKTLIELLVMAEMQMDNYDRLVHLCRLIRTIDIQKLEFWQAEGYYNIIKKELAKIEHVFKL